MHTIIVENECGCFRRSDLENNTKIESKDEALLTAIKMNNQMNDEFCGKHKFELKESLNNFIISVPTVQKSSGCCGGGHCS